MSRVERTAVFEAARIAGGGGESISRGEHRFRDVAAQSACAAGHQPNFGHERPPVFFLYSCGLAPIRVQRRESDSASLATHSGMPGSKRIVALGILWLPSRLTRLKISHDSGRRTWLHAEHPS